MKRMWKLKNDEIKAKAVSTPVAEVKYCNQNANVRRMMGKYKGSHAHEKCRNIELYTVTNSTEDLSQNVKNMTRKFKPAAKVKKIRMESCCAMEIKFYGKGKTIARIIARKTITYL